MLSDELFAKCICSTDLVQVACGSGSFLSCFCAYYSDDCTEGAQVASNEKVLGNHAATPVLTLTMML